MPRTPSRIVSARERGLSPAQAVVFVGLCGGLFGVWLLSRGGLFFILEALGVEYAMRPPSGDGGYRMPFVFALVLTGITAVACWRDRARSVGYDLWERAVPMASIWLTGTVLIVGTVSAAIVPLSWDESMLLYAGAVLRSEGIVEFTRVYPELPWLGDRHPPLGALIATLGVGAGSLFAGRMVFLPFLLLAVLTTRWIGERLYGPSVGFAAGLAFLCFRYVDVYATRATLDVSAVALVALALALAIHSRDRGRGWILASGLALAFAVLTRYTAGLAVIPLAAVLLAPSDGRSVWQRVGRLATAGIPGVLLVGGWFVVLWKVGGLDVQFSVIAEHAVESKAGGGAAESFVPWSNVSRAETILLLMPSSLGLWMAPAVCLGTWEAMRRRGPEEWGLAVWVLGFLLPLLLTLPIPRYFMPAYPALAVLVALALHRLSLARLPLIVLLLGLSVLSLFVYDA